MRMQNLLITILACIALAGCSLPRGAPVSGEILDGAESETADFAVVNVDGASVEAIRGWPSGFSGTSSAGWLSAQSGKPSDLAVGDHLDITVWDLGEASLMVAPGQRFTVLPTVNVAQDGTVFIPYAGNVHIAGMSLSEAREAIEQALAKLSSSSLQATLHYTAGENSSIDIIGGVVRAGTYPLGAQGETVLSLLSKAGGALPSLNHPELVLLRAGHRYEIWLEDLVKSPRRDIPLRGGDKITISPDKRFFQAFGATGREELVYFNRSTITARESLSMVGGLSDTRANLKGLLVLREYPVSAVGRGPTHERVIFTFDMTSADGLFSANRFDIKPGDLVLATESAIASANTVIGLIRSTLALSAQLSYP